MIMTVSEETPYKFPIVRCCCGCHHLYIDGEWIIDEETHDIFFNSRVLSHGYCEKCFEKAIREIDEIYKK